MNATNADKLTDAVEQEPRRMIRERTFLPARISFGDGALSTECTVTQLSAAGARLTLAPGFSLPDRFDLIIPQRGLNNRATLVWRKDVQVGVEFDFHGSGPTMASEQDYIARIHELEAANAKLRAQVSDLVLQVQRLTDN